MLKTKFTIAVALFTLIVGQSCKKEVFDVSEPEKIVVPEDDCKGVFYEEGAKSIIDAKCVTCHIKDGIGKGDYTKKDVLASELQKIKKEAVTDKRMPTDGELSDAEIETLRNWIDCGGQFAPAVGGGVEEPMPLVYEKDIKSIITAKCVTCHTSGGSGQGDFSKTSEFKTAAEKGRIQARVIDQKTMPEAGSPQLTKEELDKITKWLNEGAKFE